MDAFEQQLADEGGNSSFSGPAREQLQLAFHEQFALAADVHAKRDVVRRALLPDSPEALYYAALCDLMEVQQALTLARSSSDSEGRTPCAAEVDKAAELLKSTKYKFATMASKLETNHYCPKKTARVKQRLLLLTLELQHLVAASGRDEDASADTVRCLLVLSHTCSKYVSLCCVLTSRACCVLLLFDTEARVHGDPKLDGHVL